MPGGRFVDVGISIIHTLYLYICKIIVILIRINIHIILFICSYINTHYRYIPFTPIPRFLIIIQSFFVSSGNLRHRPWPWMCACRSGLEWIRLDDAPEKPTRKQWLSDRYVVCHATTGESLGMDQVHRRFRHRNTLRERERGDKGYVLLASFLFLRASSMICDEEMIVCSTD